MFVGQSKEHRFEKRRLLEKERGRRRERRREREREREKKKNSNREVGREGTIMTNKS